MNYHELAYFGGNINNMEQPVTTCHNTLRPPLGEGWGRGSLGEGEGVEVELLIDCFLQK